MSNSKSSENSIPVVADVDLLVFGGTCTAVSFALAAKRKGASVYVVSSFPYLGEDVCAAYRFWPEADEGNELSGRIFSENGHPPTPMQVKLTLEQSLVKEKVPFLFNCFPAGLLRSESGVIGGAVIANRSGHQAIRARLVVDATVGGLVLEQAGFPVQRLSGLQQVDYAVFYEGTGPTEPSPAEFVELQGYENLSGHGGEGYSIVARRYSVTEDFGDGSAKARADAFSRITNRCWLRKEFRHQTMLTARPARAMATPDLSQSLVEPCLLALSEGYSLADSAESIFANPISAMRVAEDFGRAIVEDLPASVTGEMRVCCDGAVPLKEGEVRTLRDALRAGGRKVSEVAFDFAALPVLNRFDVVVVGGGTGGAPAGIAAARAGASTLVVETTSGLGGVGTMGQIAKYWHGNRVGFTAEIDQGVRGMEHDPAFQADQDGWTVAAKKAWYHRTGFEAGVTYWFNTLCVGTVVKDDTVTGLILAGPYGYGLVEAGCVVDSTGCSDIPAAAGAPTVVIGKEHVAVQGTGLAGIQPGRDYHNSDHNFSDDSDVVDATSFFVSSKLKFKGDFDCGELIDSRERRQIVGDYTLSPVDILYRRRFPDTVCVATSNFDSHGFTVDPTFMLIPPNKEPLWADIPIGCFLPKSLEGVIVTGLGLSAHRDALPVIRMQADVQNQGYVAGRMAALSALREVPIRELPLSDVQQHLIEIGSLPERVLTDEDSFPVPDSAIQAVIDRDWDTLSGVALLLHEGQRSRHPLQEAYRGLSGERSRQSLRYAQILGLLGDASGEVELIEAIEGRDWDAGWRFRGMHQFGMNMSELDALLVCLGNCGGAAAWPCLLHKLKTLPEEAEFSHVRALTMSIESLYARCPNGDVAPIVASILDREGYQGHVQLDVSDAQSALSENINENRVRDDTLRELHLARLLFHCGDHGQRGEVLLRQYAKDCRGHFARHANALLSR